MRADIISRRPSLYRDGDVIGDAYLNVFMAVRGEATISARAIGHKRACAKFPRSRAHEQTRRVIFTAFNGVVQRYILLADAVRRRPRLCSSPA